MKLTKMFFFAQKIVMFLSDLCQIETIDSYEFAVWFSQKKTQSFSDLFLLNWQFRGVMSCTDSRAQLQGNFYLGNT